ncbi:MAG: hypothetical protein A3K19_14300 [Lentisphaerae bacterium RIFOXYB12_FULL_65_16]|nr:MAG: hypothetical protein A3K18_18345 [Lentisphaerae bacterium RIFOXYA12_64_32]OGV87394.1 MAG: hypothetical protein A3K19_14300 [Lentisphaerae bacterium RIFOXYB12_FULL_65_16]
MLFKQGLIKHEVAKKLLTVLADSDHEQGQGGEDWLKKKLNGDEYTASAVNLGRTLQEPMARMQMREKVSDVIDVLLRALERTLDKAEENADAVMAGQSHFSHAQPTTYGAYLLAVHDGLARGLAQLELAYRAARISDEPEPHLTTAQVQDAMGLETFFDKHCNLGDPCPSETRRMIGLRRDALRRLQERQAERKARIDKASARLAEEIVRIVQG